MQSSIPGVKSALVTRLQAVTGLAAVQVSYGNPYPDVEEREAVFLGKVTRQPLDFMAAMTQANETYSLDVLVSIIVSSLSPCEDAEARAYAVADLVTASVLSWQLEGYGGHAVIVLPGGSTSEESVDGDVREVSVLLTFDVTARI